MVINRSWNEIRIFYPPSFPLVAYNCSRYPTFRSSISCPYPGFMVEIMNFLADAGNFTIIPSWYSDREENRDEWLPKAFEMLLNGSIDLMAYTYTITQSRLEHFDFSEPLYIPQNYIVRRAKNHQLENTFSFFRSYDSKIWMAIFFVWLIQWLCCVLSQRLNYESNDQRFPSIFEEAWRVLRLQLLQYRELEQKSNASSKLSISVFSFFQCYILLGLFSSLILASILRPQVINENALEFFINSIKSGRYKFAVRATNYWLFDRINHSKEYPYHELRHALKKNPVKLVNTKDEIFESILNDESITMLQSDDHEYYYIQNYCNLEVMDKEVPAVGSHLMYVKGSPLKAKLADAIKHSRLKIDSIMNKYTLLAHKYKKCSSDDEKIKPLKIFPYIGTSILCFGLIFISTLAFIIEIVYFQCRKHLKIQWK